MSQRTGLSALKPVLCDMDGPIAKFRRQYATFYVDYDEAQRIAALNLK